MPVARPQLDPAGTVSEQSDTLPARGELTRENSPTTGATPTRHAPADAFWPPPHGRANGSSAARWAAIAEVTPQRAGTLLAALRQAGVPAHAAQIRPRSLREVDTRIWVDADRYARADNVLLAELAHGSSASSPAPRRGGETATRSEGGGRRGSLARRLTSEAIRRCHAALDALIQLILVARSGRRR